MDKMNLNPMYQKDCPMKRYGVSFCSPGPKSFRMRYYDFDYYICDNHIRYTKKQKYVLTPLTNGEKIESE